ncbi:MAG: Asp-tRNA(Asn)/Glu-tRNA(Gln) amidotransferase subunit GatB, partial [Betaproteobacteria bacterium]|nr:Asp-tRNA(Asn)/Glu-tRNA(Gln) amidotransferase subunit GatB [Betaproteobacteria bacterium]
GVLPVANRDAVEKAIRFGLAVNGNQAGNINRRSIFARKNYFYPDLPKGYQISQYETPIVKGGSVSIFVDGKEKTVRLTRAHLEEDAGKSLHEGFHDFTGIDLNRAGTPLLEVVSEPDLRSAEEAVAYAKALHVLVRWIGICDGNMQEGSFRCDANVSVRISGTKQLGIRSEIKNLNSFRFLERAIEFEVKRQIEILEDGGKIVQETRLYDADKDETRSMRTKEDAHDYRYFPDPDLLPLEVSEKWINEIKSTMPELPQAKREQYVRRYELSPYDAALLTASRKTAEYFETSLSAVDVVAMPSLPKLSANLINVDLATFLNREDIDIESCPIRAEHVGKLARSLSNGTISSKIKKEILEAMWAGEGDPDAIIEKRGLKQISDSGELERACDEVIAKNAKQVEDYRAGKDKAFNSLVGQVMKLTGGKANPQQVSEILRRKLAG